MIGSEDCCNKFAVYDADGIINCCCPRVNVCRCPLFCTRIRLCSGADITAKGDFPCIITLDAGAFPCTITLEAVVVGLPSVFLDFLFLEEGSVIESGRYVTSLFVVSGRLASAACFKISRFVVGDVSRLVVESFASEVILKGLLCGCCCGLLLCCCCCCCCGRLCFAGSMMLSG